MPSSDLLLKQIYKAVDLGLLKQLRWSSLTKLLVLGNFGKESHCIGSRGKMFVPNIAILKKRIIVSVTLANLGPELTSKIELFVRCHHHIEAYTGLLQTSEMESFKKIVNS